MHCKKKIKFVFFSVCHRDIGALYFLLAFFAGLVGAFLIAFFFVVEKINKIQIIPFLDTIYAFIIISFMTIPAIFCGFGNFLVPPMVGAKGMAFPTLNRLGFWIYVFAFFIMIMILTDFYQKDISFLLSLSLHSIAVSSILCATNFVVTVLVMRNPYRSFKVFSPFIWSILVTSFLVLLYMPVMAVSGTMALLGHLSFFDEENIAQQNARFIAWFLTHPETYILLFPTFGLLEHIFMTGSCIKRSFVVEKTRIFLQIIVGGGGIILWTENLFHNANLSALHGYFSTSLLIIVLPASFVILAWLIMLIGKKKSSPAFMLWIWGFIYILVTGMLFSVLDPESSIKEIVLHFHYCMAVSSIFSICAGCYFWFPVVFGLEIRSKIISLHFWTMFLAVNFAFMVHFSSTFLSYLPFENFVRIFWDNRNKFLVFTLLITATLPSVFIYAVVKAYIRDQSATQLLSTSQNFLENNPVFFRQEKYHVEE